MEHKLSDLHIFISLLLLTGISKSLSALHSRKGFFLDDIDPAKLDSSKTISLKTVYAPSELACSQKCFGIELCSYKSFDPFSGKCELLREISSEDVKKKKKVSKKVNVCLIIFVFKWEAASQPELTINIISGKQNVVSTVCCKRTLIKTLNFSLKV